MKVIRSVLVAVLSLVIAGAPAMAECSWRSKATECNRLGRGPDDIGGCSVETSDGWYDIKMRGSRFRATQVCEKYPAPGYCSCSDYGIY